LIDDEIPVADLLDHIERVSRQRKPRIGAEALRARFFMKKKRRRY